MMHSPTLTHPFHSNDHEQIKAGAFWDSSRTLATTKTFYSATSKLPLVLARCIWKELINTDRGENCKRLKPEKIKVSLARRKAWRYTQPNFHRTTSRKTPCSHLPRRSRQTKKKFTIQQE